MEINPQAEPSEKLSTVHQIGMYGDFIRTFQLIVVEAKNRREFRTLDGTLVGVVVSGHGGRLVEPSCINFSSQGTNS